jgi:hypothetical protein
MRGTLRGTACQGYGAPGVSHGVSGDGLPQPLEAARIPGMPTACPWAGPAAPGIGWTVWG